MKRIEERLDQFEQRLKHTAEASGGDPLVEGIALHLVRASVDLKSYVEATALRDAGLSHAGFEILVQLRLGGSAEPRELARAQGVSRPAIVGTVDTLERAGLVRRRRSTEDRRLVFVDLTAKGRQVIERVHVRANGRVREVASVLSDDEKVTMANLLRRLGSQARELARESKLGATA